MFICVKVFQNLHSDKQSTPRLNQWDLYINLILSLFFVYYHKFDTVKFP